MRFNKVILMVLISAILLMISTVAAADLSANATDQLLESGNSIYVDDLDGNDLNDATSWDTSVKSFSKALELSNKSDTIYLASGNYTSNLNTRITIDKSVNVVGSSDTTFDGQNEDFLFVIEDNVHITFKNIKFANFYKVPRDDEHVYGSVLDIKNASVTLEDCTFLNNVVDHNSFSAVFGGAVSNFGDLTIINSCFINNTVNSARGLFSAGGAIYNNGRLTIKNSSISNSRAEVFSNGGAIANWGYMEISDSLISSSYISSQSKGSAVYNAGEFILTNSVISDSFIEKTGIDQFYGAIYNSGDFTGWGNIFANNTGSFDASSIYFKGTGNIYNIGNLNLTYNAFINEEAYDLITSDVYYDGGEIISLDNNWWNTNDNPYDESRVNLDEMVESWLTFTLTPQYSTLNISDKVTITAQWKSTIDTLEIELFPIFNTTFTTQSVDVTRELKNGKADFIFDETQKKGQYTVTADVCGFSQSVLVDVGKLPSSLTFNVTDNIQYLDNLTINVSVKGSGKSPGGIVRVFLNNKPYIIKLNNSCGSITISKLNPGTYDLTLAYEGDEDYFKSFANTTVTVKKLPVNLTLEIPSIKIDEKSTTATAILNTVGAQGQAVLYLNGVRKQNVYLYNGQTSITLRNLKEGQYNATLVFMGSAKYESVNVTATFTVSKYSTVLNIYADDINAGKTAHILIEALPEDLRGEAILQINDFNTTVWINNTNTTVNISNLAYGRYDVSLIYMGDSRYYGANDTTSFRVLRQPSSLNVTIDKNDDNLNGKVTVRANPLNCTGMIGVYINYKFYSKDLTDGEAIFEVEFDQGTNYIFIYYVGDDHFEDSTWNATIGVADQFVFIGENSTAFEHNDFNYSVRLVEVTGIPMPQRHVSVNFNNETYDITTDDDGFAYLPLNLNEGIYFIEATYENQTINNTITVKAIEFSITVNDTYYGNPVYVEVNFNGNVTGNVNLCISDILDVTLPIYNGKVIYNISNLNASGYKIIAKYVNDYYNSSQKTVNFRVKKANLNLSVDFKQKEFKITVNNLENASGNVSFIIDGVEYVNSTNNSQAVLFKSLSDGNHTLTVRYAGDKNYNSATLDTYVFVKMFFTDVKLTVDDGVYGSELTAYAHVVWNATGIIRFSIGNYIRDVEIQNGLAKLTFGGLNVGNYTIKASYLGDVNFLEEENATSFKIIKANSTIVVYVNEAVLDENIRIYANLSANATGSVLFSMDGYYSPRYKNVRDSQSIWYISPLTTGSYRIFAVYGGDNNYNPSNTTYILDIYQKKSILEVNIDDARVIDRIVADVKLTNKSGVGLNASVVLEIDSKSYDIDVYNGEASIVLGRFDAGNYTYAARYAGDEEYAKASVKGSFEVRDTLLDVVIVAGNLTKYYSGSQQLSITLKTANNKSVAYKEVFVTINGKEYKISTDKNGVATMDINLKTGNYTAVISIEKDDFYHEASKNVSIKILSTVEAIDLIKLNGTSGQYFAIFCDAEGKMLSNKQVKFKIGNKSYSVKTLPNGIVRLNINLNPGKYVITAINPVTTQKAKNNIFIYLRLMENKDVRKYYGSSKSYKVRAYGDNGSVVAGVKVKIKVNGKTYKVKTDKKGYATLKINLKPGKYTIKATYKGYTVSNKVTVKTTLITKNISKKKSKAIKFKAKLLNGKGKVLKSKKITFKFKGKKYTAKTNSKGIATVTLKNLLKAGKYKIKTSYGKLTVKNTIKIK